MSPQSRFTTIVLALAIGPALAARAADEIAVKGREIFQKYQHVTVTVQLVLKSKMSMPGYGGRSNESKQDATGTTIDPSGLTVLSLSATDPGSILSGMASGEGDGGPDLKFKMENELTDVKILTHDGAELPAEVVLRDKDLDLAFVRPKQRPAAPMPAIDLSHAGEAQLLDQVITLNRLGKVAGRAYAASVERISAVVLKPRTFYAVGGDATATTLGSPAFTLDGQLLGVFVLRIIKGGDSGGGGLMGFNFQPEGLRPIILPASTIQKAAKQAPELKEKL